MSFHVGIYTGNTHFFLLILRNWWKVWLNHAAQLYIGVQLCLQGAGATATFKILAFCRYCCLEEGTWSWQSLLCKQWITRQWATGKANLKTQGAQKRWQ